MFGLLFSIVIFNFCAFTLCKNLTGNQILHIWTFTTAFQATFDLIVEFKYQGYWYFDPGVDWSGLLAHSILLPPVNMMVLNWYPYKKPARYHVSYLLALDIILGLYELLVLLPSPWGYFTYGWWTIWHSLIINPVLILIIVAYYQLIKKLEKRLL